MKKSNPSSRRRPGSFARLVKIPAFAGMTLLFFTLSAHAGPFTYSPAHCEFNITFPEKPFIEEKCSGTDKKDCDEVVTFTKAIDASSVNFRVTCLKEDSKILETYTHDALLSSLDTMVKEAGVESFAKDSATIDGYIKSAVNLASGVRNEREIVYTGQIWTGKTSILNMEGEMAGPQNKQIDDIYSEILKSISPKKP